MDKKQINLAIRSDLPSFSATRSLQLVASKGQSLRMLETYFETMNLTPSKLAKLIGCGNSSTVFNWVSGQSSPSQPYCFRLIHLAMLVMGGVPLALVRTICWDDLTIEWHKGCEPEAESEGPIMPFVFSTNGNNS